MNDKSDSDWSKFFNAKGVKKNLIETSLFLAFYEIMKSIIIDRIFMFYSDHYQEGKWGMSEKYKELILAKKYKGKANTFLASCDWLLESNAISSSDLEEILRIKDERNRIAHNLQKFLIDSDFVLNPNYINSIREISLKIEKWWIIEFEIPINPDFDGVDIDYDGIIPGQDLIFNYIFNIAYADLDELERLIENAKKTN